MKVQEQKTLHKFPPLEVPIIIFSPHPEPPSHLPPHPLGHHSAPTPSTLSHALNLDW